MSDTPDPAAIARRLTEEQWLLVRGVLRREAEGAEAAAVESGWTAAMRAHITRRAELLRAAIAVLEAEPPA